MTDWIKLLDEKPIKKGIYKCLCLGYYPKEWREEFLQWTNVGFQPLDYGSRESYPINKNVSYWFKVEEKEPPIVEAQKLIIETEVFFKEANLNTFAEKNNIEIFEESGNAVEYIISNISESIIKEMRTKFKSNGTHFNVPKCKL